MVRSLSCSAGDRPGKSHCNGFLCVLARTWMRTHSRQPQRRMLLRFSCLLGWSVERRRRSQMPEALAGDRTIDVDFVGALAGCRLHSKQHQYGACQCRYRYRYRYKCSPSERKSATVTADRTAKSSEVRLKNIGLVSVCSHSLSQLFRQRTTSRLYQWAAPPPGGSKGRRAS